MMERFTCTKLPCSTEQNGVCIFIFIFLQMVLWSEGNIKTQHKEEETPTVLPEFHNCRLQDYNSTNINALTWEH
jgi:hypothetical protein